MGYGVEKGFEPTAHVHARKFLWLLKTPSSERTRDSRCDSYGVSNKLVVRRDPAECLQEIGIHSLPPLLFLLVGIISFLQIIFRHSDRFVFHRFQQVSPSFP
jgi:hypothetical protein